MKSGNTIDKTHTMRRRFTEANAYLNKARATRIHDDGRPLLARIKAGGMEALAEVAEELQEAGIYSQKTGGRAVQFGIMRRLFALHGKQQTWNQFTTGLLGDLWWNTKAPRKGLTEQASKIVPIKTRKRAA